HVSLLLLFPCLYHLVIVLLYHLHSFTVFLLSSSSSFFFIYSLHPLLFQTISPNFLVIINLSHFFPHFFNLLHFLLFPNLSTLFLLPISSIFLISIVYHQHFSLPVFLILSVSSFSF